jgi:hypothetical protein
MPDPVSAIAAGSAVSGVADIFGSQSAADARSGPTVTRKNARKVRGFHGVLTRIGRHLDGNLVAARRFVLQGKHVHGG